MSHWHCISLMICCIVSSAMGEYASYSSLMTFRPWLLLRVIPLKMTTAPSASDATRAAMLAVSIGSGVTSMYGSGSTCAPPLTGGRIATSSPSFTGWPAKA